MKLLKILVIATFAMFAASAAHADSSLPCSVDSTVHPTSSTGHSPTIGSGGSILFTVGADGCAVADLAVTSGTVTEFTISIPLVDLHGLNICGPSNSYFTTLAGIFGSTANGMFTCTYYTAATDPFPVIPDPPGATETLAQMQADCLKFGIFDADDCIGTPSGLDLITTITGLPSGLNQGDTFSGTYTALGVPEPASFSLLLIGLAGLPFARRKFAR